MNEPLNVAEYQNQVTNFKVQKLFRQGHIC